MAKRIAAIAFIFLCTSIAWIILGGSIELRTDSAETETRGRVESNWGTPQTQCPPDASASFTAVAPRKEEGATASTKLKTQSVFVSLPLESSQVRVAIHLDQRKKGLLWYSTYRDEFDGTYTFENSSANPVFVSFSFPLPAKQAVYDDLQVSVDDSLVNSVSKDAAVVATATVAARTKPHFHVKYRSQGLDSWGYSFGESASSVKNFELRLITDFKGFDFAENTLGPTAEHLSGSGRELIWSYSSLVSGFPIRLQMPQKIQPGPLAGRISFFAPVSLLFSFFVLFILCTIRGVDLHPINYFFIACTFFSFHLLLAYLVDHISIHAAFAICSVVSISLLVSYLVRVVDSRFAIRDAGLVQLVYLVLFSYAFFFEGFTGLSITIGAILTLFIAMQMTARIRWSEKFAKTSA